ncbi:SIR2 family protein [Herbaspirillum seropedicae]|uniref:SIR2 family protein n=1 Tax=Herbaspirillum seropedicae TaxID=964 RepID=UPI000863A3F5|nr:SIR2 family protein [Herbaspirillum seropedicae]AON54689.1 hypothetical protein Hsc_2404 [Herbaspirillum seropedicae]
MPIDVVRLAAEIDPAKTILFFGAGASLASNAPSVGKLMEHFSTAFGIDSNGYSLREFSGIIENQFGRNRLITELRKLFAKLHPTGSLLNLPLYPWKSIFTTNYDTLIEQCYSSKRVPLTLFESNFDFAAANDPSAVKYFKLHGSIDKDICDGRQTRIVITDSDYDYTQSYREGLFDRLKADFYGAHLIIIGHSLADEDIKSVANRCAEISSSVENAGRVTLMMYNNDANRAQLWEKRGFQVCFGGIDQLFSALATKLPHSSLVFKTPEQPLDHAHALRPVTIDVRHAADADSDVSNMFNGWPASYADIQAKLTFPREIVPQITDFLDQKSSIAAVILGASGLGKTTAARQLVLSYSSKEYYCWEHKSDFQLNAKDWLAVAKSLATFNAKPYCLSTRPTSSCSS